MNRLADVATQLGPDQAAMMWLGAVCGLRWAEAAGITVDRLNLLASTITIDRQLNRGGEFAPPKSVKSERTFAIPAGLVNELAASLARRNLTAADGNALVFTSPTGGPLRYTNWRRRVCLLPAIEKAGFPDLKFHRLRGLATTALIAGGVNVKTAQDRLGHSSPAVTLGIYARATEAADQDAAKTLGNVFRLCHPGAIPEPTTDAPEGAGPLTSDDGGR